MKTCTFFSHRDCPDSIRTLLVKQVENPIENQEVAIPFDEWLRNHDQPSFR